MLDRRIRRRAALCIGIALSLQLPAASAEPVAFEHARLLPIDAPPIDDGVLVVDDGKIVALGAAADVRIPSDARRVDLRGKQVMPGLVDTHSHVGIATRPLVGAHLDFNENSGPVQPALRALDAINPDDPAIRMAVAGGVTTANVMPGSGNIIGGQTAYVKLAGARIEDMLIDGALGGLKMANGENAKNSYGSRGLKPVTRMAEASLAREQFIKAQEYRAAKQRWNDEGSAWRRCSTCWTASASCSTTAIAPTTSPPCCGSRTNSASASCCITAPRRTSWRTCSRQRRSRCR